MSNETSPVTVEQPIPDASWLEHISPATLEQLEKLGMLTYEQLDTDASDD